MCVRFLFVQPGVVSTCSVTELISCVNSFAAVFTKGVLEFVWIFLVGPFLRHVSKSMWGCDCWLFGHSLVCNFLENSALAFFSTLTEILILHISDKRWIPAFSGALRFGGVAFPVHRTSQLTLNLKPVKTRLERIRSNREPPRSS